MKRNARITLEHVCVHVSVCMYVGKWNVQAFSGCFLASKETSHELAIRHYIWFELRGPAYAGYMHSLKCSRVGSRWITHWWVGLVGWWSINRLHIVIVWRRKFIKVSEYNCHNIIVGNNKIIKFLRHFRAITDAFELLASCKIAMWMQFWCGWPQNWIPTPQSGFSPLAVGSQFNDSSVSEGIWGSLNKLYAACFNRSLALSKKK